MQEDSLGEGEEVVEGEEEDEGVKQEQQQQEQDECKAVDLLGQDAQHYNALINYVTLQITY